MELNYNVTEDDYIAYNVFHYENTPALKNQTMIIGILVPILVVVIGFTAKGGFDTFSLGVAGLFVLFWFLFAKQHRKSAVKQSIKKLIKKGGGQEFIGPHKLKLHENDIVAEITNKITATSYNAVEKIGRDDSHFYIYVGSMSAYIIPFSAFESTAQRDEFLAVITARSANLQPK